MVEWQKMQEVTTVWCKSFFFDNPIFWSSYLRVKLLVITKHYVDLMIKIRNIPVWFKDVSDVDDGLLNTFLCFSTHFSML